MFRIIPYTIITFSLLAMSCKADSTHTQNNQNDLSKFYVLLDIGYTQVSDYKNNTLSKYLPKKSTTYSPTVGIEVGYKFSNNLRAGLALYTANNQFNRKNNTMVNANEVIIWEEEKIRTTALILNGYYDFGTFKSITPYFTLGGGISFNQTKDVTIEYYFPNVNYPRRDPYTTQGAFKASFAWSTGVGILAPISEDLNLNLALKYFNFGQSTTSDTSVSQGTAYYTGPLATKKITAIAAMIGIQYKL